MICGRCLTIFPPGSKPIETPCPVCEPNESLLNKLIQQGFNLSYETKAGGVRVRCGSCEACTIMGVATHEHNCPNAKKARQPVEGEQDA